MAEYKVVIAHAGQICSYLLFSGCFYYMKMIKGRISSILLPYIAVIILQLGLGGMDIFSKAALNKGISTYVFATMRQLIATLSIAPFAIYFDRNKRPQMIRSTFIKIFALSILEPVANQNLTYMGISETTATFGAALWNMIPGITFVLASLLRLENFSLRRPQSQSKLIGTIMAVTGAMVMTLVRGQVIIRRTKAITSPGDDEHRLHWVKGGLMISAGCICEASFVILQTFTLKAYPTELSLATWICFLGTVEGVVLALIMERNNLTPSFSIKFDVTLLAAAYSGIVCSGVAYYIQGLVIRAKGPVFATAFNPLALVFVAVLSFFILGEQMDMGRVLGALIIVFGLYFIVWGMNKERNEIPRSGENIQDQEQPVREPT